MISKKIKIMLFLYAILTLGFMTTSLVSYFVAKSSLTDQITSDTLPLIGDTIYSEIQRDLLTPVLISSLMAKDTFLQDWVRAGEKDITQITNYLEEIKTSYNAVTSFFVSDKTLNYYRYTGLSKTISQESAFDQWFFNVKKMSASHEVKVDNDESTNNSLTVFINYKVLDKEGQFLGVTGIGLALSDVKFLLNEYKEKYNREIFFIDPQGNLKLPISGLATDLDLNQKIHDKTLKELIVNKDTASINFTDDATKIMLNSRYVEEFNWYLIVKQNDNNYEDKIYDSLLLNLLLSLVITTIVLIITWFTLGQYQKRLETMAVTDKLTGLKNRQLFDPVLDQQFSLAQRNHSDLAVIIMDIDNFKLINDRYGHPFGDKVLIEIARLLESLQRSSDVLCRWGGEEFLLLMPGCDQQQARAKAQQIQNILADKIFNIDAIELQIRFSIGIADNQLIEGHQPEKLIFQADQALLNAKQNGKNQIVCYSSETA